MGWSTVLATWSASPASTRGCSGSSYEETEASVSSEWDKDGRVPYGGAATLSRRFSARVISLLASSVGSTFSGWVNVGIRLTKRPLVAPVVGEKKG